MQERSRDQLLRLRRPPQLDGNEVGLVGNAFEANNAERRAMQVVVDLRLSFAAREPPACPVNSGGERERQPMAQSATA